MRQIVTFDAYGTLVNFQLGPTTLKVLADRLDLDGLDVDEFLDDFRVMRFQAVLEAYRPYHEILHSSLRDGHAPARPGVPRRPTATPSSRPCPPSAPSPRSRTPCAR